MTKCPKCGKALKKEIEKVYEIDDVKYFDIDLKCVECGYSKPVTVKRKDPVPKAPDTVTEMAASLKLREYMPKRKSTPIQEPIIRGEELKKVFSPLKHRREILIYTGAILLGLAVEAMGLYFEGYLRTVRIDPLAGFVLSLVIFVLGPILIAGGAVYYATNDKLKALFLGSLAVPLTIILLAKLGF